MPKSSNMGETKVKTVNSQITDAITQSNAMITGMAPAHSMAALYQTMSQAMGTGIQNSVSNQQHVNSVGLAALAQNLQLLMQPAQPKTVVQMLPPIIVQSEQQSSGSRKAKKRPKPKTETDTDDTE